MRLATFLRQSSDEIVAHSVAFAGSLAPLSNQGIDTAVLRNHLPLVLEAIALDLEQPQTRKESITKSEGHGHELPGESAAQTHGRMRADTGLTVSQVVAEYRVLRAVVLRLWMESERHLDATFIPDIVRLNEAIDQAIAESVRFHSAEVERWRDTMLAVVSHDLRGPVQTIVSLTGVLSNRGSESFPTYLPLLQRGADRLSALLDSLLDYSKVRLGTGLSLNRTMADLEKECRSEVDLIVAGDPTIPVEFSSEGSSTGQFDAGRIREALSNLVSNAVQYRTPETPIRIVVEGRPESVLISVANSGQAIAPEVLQVLFEPLRRREESTASGSRRNLGIGLFVVREIVKAHGGNVSANATDGLVTFSMLLPKRVSGA